MNLRTSIISLTLPLLFASACATAITDSDTPTDGDDTTDTGGSTGSGGETGTGGGLVGTGGGLIGTGGGTSSTGGATSTGGSTSTGGAAATGGATSTGGTTGGCPPEWTAQIYPTTGTKVSLEGKTYESCYYAGADLVPSSYTGTNCTVGDPWIVTGACP